MTDKLILALDVDSAADALALVRRLKPQLSLFKVGLQLFTREGPAFIRALRAEGVDLFLDLKFHDIPQTVANAVRAAVALDVRYVTIHAGGGLAMMQAAQAGVPGLVCSPHEISLIREGLAEPIKLITPGVRSGTEAKQDQKRTLTAVEAFRRGANHLVIGRPITQAPDPVVAAQAILAECGIA
jgi:orotidine-5'-phosphate decarboxylase